MFIAENLKDPYAHPKYNHSYLYHPEVTTNNLIFRVYIYVHTYLDYIHAHLHRYIYEHIIIYV